MDLLHDIIHCTLHIAQIFTSKQRVLPFIVQHPLLFPELEHVEVFQYVWAVQSCLPNTVQHRVDPLDAHDLHNPLNTNLWKEKSVVEHFTYSHERWTFSYWCRKVFCLKLGPNQREDLYIVYSNLVIRSLLFRPIDMCVLQTWPNVTYLAFVQTSGEKGWPLSIRIHPVKSGLYSLFCYFTTEVLLHMKLHICAWFFAS